MHTVVKVNSNGHLASLILRVASSREAESTCKFKILCEDMPER